MVITGGIIDNFLFFSSGKEDTSDGRQGNTFISRLRLFNSFVGRNKKQNATFCQRLWSFPIWKKSVQMLTRQLQVSSLSFWVPQDSQCSQIVQALTFITYLSGLSQDFLSLRDQKRDEEHDPWPLTLSRGCKAKKAKNRCSDITVFRSCRKNKLENNL